MQKSGGLTEKSSQYGVWTKIYVVGILGFKKKKVVARFCWVVWRRMVQKLAYWWDIFLHMNWLDKIERFLALKGNWILGGKYHVAKENLLMFPLLPELEDIGRESSYIENHLGKTAAKKKNSFSFLLPLTPMYAWAWSFLWTFCLGWELWEKEKNLVSCRLI